MLKAAIVTIGDEILIGQIVDTNSAWLGKELNKHGVIVSRILSISDNVEEIYSTLKMCRETYDLTLVTGGLGPTKDDITKKVLCDLFESKLIQHPESYAITKEILGRRNIEMNALNKAQSLVPDKCEVIINHNGTAPAMLFHHGKNILISMPGVPFEMIEICKEYVFDIITKHFGLHNNIHRNIVTFGIAESILAEKIEEWENALPPYLHLAYLPNPSRVRLRLSAYDVQDTKMVDNEITEKFDALRKLIPEFYIGEEDTEVEVSLSNILRERNETLSVAESCTGGNIAAKITSLSGSSDIFLGGIVSYSNQAKQNILGVNSKGIESFGAVSQQVVEQMAQGVRKLNNSTYSIATSGIAGPNGGSEEKPVGTVWIAIDTPQGTFSEKYLFSKLRQPNIDRASTTGLYKLLKHIQNL